MQKQKPIGLSEKERKVKYFGPTMSTKGTMDPEGARSLTYSTMYERYKPRLCINIHNYAPPLIVLQQTPAVDAALHALRRQYTSEGSMSSFKSIT